MRTRVAIIGAGLGGLSAAIHLAASGYQVQVFEQNETPGGKMSELRTSGFRFDTGPSLLTMPQVIDDLFAVAGEKRSNYLAIEAVDPACRYFWNDGTQVDTHVDVARMQSELARISATDAQAYPDFLQYSRDIYDLTADVFLQSPIHEWQKLLTRRNLSRLLQIRKMDPMRTMHRGVKTYFEDPKIVQLFDRFATYNGSNPYQAPATLNIIPYVELGMGAFYVRGGMFRLAEALLQLCEKTGVKIHLSSHVDRIEQQNGSVAGVQVNGKFVAADTVVCNADVAEAHRELIVEDDGRLENLEPSLSGMVFMWGVQGKQQKLAHHNILFSDDYRQEFRQIFDDGQAPDDPTVYIAITSKSDPDHAPDGCENWFVLLNMPYLKPGQHWSLQVERMRRAIHHKLLKQGIDIRESIMSETVWTPEDFYRRFGSNKGSIYGLSSNSKFAAFRRPANRSRKIRGLYFAGGSTHPGGGIPLVLLSGKIVSQLIREQHPAARHQREKQNIYI